MGAALAATCAGAAYFAAHELRSSFASEASAAERVAVAHPAPRPAVPWNVHVDVQPARRHGTGFFLGQDDQLLLEPLIDSQIAEVKLNRGGTSLSLRVDFENGARAAVKPRQIHPHSKPRRELAAYRLNRLLGMSSVPPAVGRRFEMADLVDHIPDGRDVHKFRIETETVPEPDGTILAELSWWIPDLADARIEGYNVDSTDGIVTWKRYLTIGNDIPEKVEPMVAQVSDMVVFDYLINNSDRWSGGNVKASRDNKILYFMDNTMSFGDRPRGHSKVRIYLERSQKFSRRLVSRLRHLRESEIRAALTDGIEPFDYLLGDDEVAAMLARRDRIIDYIDGLIEVHGADAVIVFP